MKTREKMVNQGVSSKTVQPEILGRLWVASTKLQGLGNLMSNFNHDAILNQDQAAYGIGQILLETADELESICTAIDPTTANQNNSP